MTDRNIDFHCVKCDRYLYSRYPDDPYWEGPCDDSPMCKECLQGEKNDRKKF